MRFACGIAHESGMVHFVLVIITFIPWEMALWMSHATTAVTSLLLTCWEGEWEWARLSVALDMRELHS